MSSTADPLKSTTDHNTSRIQLPVCSPTTPPSFKSSTGSPHIEERSLRFYTSLTKPFTTSPFIPFWPSPPTRSHQNLRSAYDNLLNLPLPRARPTLSPSIGPGATGPSPLLHANPRSGTLCPSIRDILHHSPRFIRWCHSCLYCYFLQRYNVSHMNNVISIKKIKCFCWLAGWSCPSLIPHGSNTLH